MNKVVLLLIFAIPKLWSSAFLEEHNCEIIEVWKGIESTFYPLEDLDKAMSNPGSFEEWLKHNCMREFDHVDSTYSYQNPRAHVILVDKNATSPYLLACLVLDSKKTNSTYLIGPKNIADELGAEVIEEVSDSLNLYDINQLPYPKASMILNEPLSVFSRDLNARETSKPRRTTGPLSVLASIERAARISDVSMNFNPSHKQIHKQVLSLCEPTNKFLLARQSGKIEKLILGPNIFFRDKHIGADLYVSPSCWTKKDMSSRVPEIASKSKVWAAGVDATQWSPLTLHVAQEGGAKLGIKKTGKQPLIYIKNRNDSLKVYITSMCRYMGWDPMIIEYGKYHHEQFRQALMNAKFAIFVSLTESQGLALAESWSMNVPTLYMLGRGTAYEGSFACSHSAPYANPNVGLPWSTLVDLQKLLESIDDYLPQFEPRKWILRNMTDEVALLELLRVIREMEDL